MISFNKEQIYIVTGASSGLGEATALLLNEFGATVVGIARNQERLSNMKSKCKNPDNMFLEIKDLAEDIENLPKYVKELKEKYGKFSGMAYCAGVAALNPIKSVSYEYAKKIFDINYFSPIFMTKGVIDKRNNIGNNVSIICVSSIDAILNDKGQSIYSGTKSALCATLKSIAKEVGKNNIRINTLLPSLIKTNMTNSAMNDGYQTGVIEKYPFGFGEPNDVANMIIYLLSDKAKFISGQNYVIDSGGVL